MKSGKPRYVFDAFALLCFLKGESGKDRVSEMLFSKIVMSAVNWAEALSRLKQEKNDLRAFLKKFKPLLGRNIHILPFHEEDGLECANLIPPSKGWNSCSNCR